MVVAEELRLMRNEEIVSYGVTFQPTDETQIDVHGKTFSNPNSFGLDLE